VAVTAEKKVAMVDKLERFFTLWSRADFAVVKFASKNRDKDMLISSRQGPSLPIIEDMYAVTWGLSL
jgi:hypothetical protein